MTLPLTSQFAFWRLPPFSPSFSLFASPLLWSTTPFGSMNLTVPQPIPRNSLPLPRSDAPYKVSLPPFYLGSPLDRLVTPSLYDAQVSGPFSFLAGSFSRYGSSHVFFLSIPPFIFDPSRLASATPLLASVLGYPLQCLRSFLLVPLTRS